MSTIGSKTRNRFFYANVQFALRRYAAKGITLEVDEDGVPVAPINHVFNKRKADRMTRRSLASSMPTMVLDEPEDLGKCVRKWRERCSITLQQTADKSGLGMRFLCKRYMHHMLLPARVTFEDVCSLCMSTYDEKIAPQVCRPMG